MAKLSILIPSRNEPLLKKTIENILGNIEDETEIIVGLDGTWEDLSYPIQVYYSPVPLGNRGMTNQLCKLSKAKYVMKADAHCAFDRGFDRKMMEDMQDDITMVPMMYNLGEDFKPKLDRCSWNWIFDKNLDFKMGDGCHDTPKEKDLVETPSLLGACFMITRERWISLNICDEDYGSWAQQWTEVALKSWQTGKLICNRKTWFSHLFRLKTDVPYPENYNEENERAKRLIRERFDIEEYRKRFPLAEKLEADNWDFYR